MSIIEVLAAIEFYNEILFTAGKIGKVGSYGMLPDELKAIQAPVTQLRP
ncbi:hypothetical protein FHX11_000947 [Rhizobium sp. BK602]|nr:hypothetical protein [Rhizobium sp. BK602]